MIRAFTIVAMLVAGPALALEFFGYAAVACNLDDPFDRTDKTDYGDEMAGWTNANMVCLPDDSALWVDHIRRAVAQYRPILLVEPAFYFGPDRPGPDSDAARQLWRMVGDAIVASRVDPGRIIFYLADEPTLRGVPPAQIDTAEAMIRGRFPAAEIMLIEAYHAEGLPDIPASISLWGFDAITISDPLAEPLYAAYVAFRAALRPGQRLVLVLDANHTPYHAAGGISLAQMGDVALAYERLAATLHDVAGMIGYTYTGGIDNDAERGLRDMPQTVQDTHHAMGRRLLGLP